MCGIAGYFCFGKNRPEKQILDNLLIETQRRGEDSTGVSFIRNKKLVVYKSPLDASDFVEQHEEWNNLKLIPSYMVMHCRKTTQGSEDNNMNNHPVFRDGLAIVHNGVIYNDDDLYDKHEFKRDAEVDTEIILALLEKHKKKTKYDDLEKSLNELRGNFAVASIDLHKPNTLTLFRHNNPLSFGLDQENEILYFASVESILDDAIVDDYMGVIEISRPLVTWDLSDNTGIVINKKGMAHKFKLTMPSHKSRMEYERSLPVKKPEATNDDDVPFFTEHGYDTCYECASVVGCVKTVKNTAYAHNCEDFVYGGVNSDRDTPSCTTLDNPTDICKECKYEKSGECTQFSDSELYCTCPLLGDMDAVDVQETSYTSCDMCSSVNTCGTVYCKVPTECHEFKERTF